MINLKLNDFLKADLLGNKFMAIRGYEPVLDRETGAISAYRLNVSIQDETSDFYMELVPLKVKSTTPTVTVDSLVNAKATPVQIKNLQVGQFNGTLWFNCEDILPISSK